MPEIAQEVARLFFQEDDDDRSPERLSAFSVRVPVSLLARIDAMAVASGQSRNAMANQLLAAGAEAVLSALPEPIREELEAEFASIDQD